MADWPLASTFSGSLNEESKMATSNDNNNSTNITWHSHAVARAERCQLHGHKGAVIWFTGLSGAGKSSVANRVHAILHKQGVSTYLLDGDNIRHGLCSDLGFSVEDRTENIRRVGHVAQLMGDAATVVLAALISPYRKERDEVRKAVLGSNKGKGIDMTPIVFGEVYVKASLETCERRDPKGLYQLARNGKIQNFTGIDDPYEEPLSPELILDSDNKTVEDLAQVTATWIQEQVRL